MIVSCVSSSRCHLPETSACSRENLRFVCRGLTTLANAGISATSLFLLLQEMNEPKPDAVRLTGYSLALGSSVRVVNALLPCPRVILEGTTRWAFETYEVLWNAYLNTSNATREHLLNAMTIWAGFHLTGDLITLVRTKLAKLKSQDEEQLRLLAQARHINDSVEPSDHPVEVKNILLRPNFNARKKTILLHTALLTGSVAVLIFTQLHGWQRASLEPFFKGLSYLFIGQGTGCLCIESFKYFYEKYLPQLTDCGLDAASLNTKLLEVMRTLGAFLPVVGVEVISAIPVSNQTLPLFIPIGFLYESIGHLTQRKFQVLTEEVYQAQIQPNLDSLVPRHKKIAIKADEMASLLFFTGFATWFIYGLVNSDTKERIEISMLLLSTLAMGILSKTIDEKFWPGRNSRLFNECHYLLFDNPLFLSIIYMLVTQVSNISDEDLNHDSLVQFIFGVFGLALFGMTLANGRVAAVSVAREEAPITTATFRMMSLLTILYRCTNRLGNN